MRLRFRVKAGIAQARSEGKPHGRPKTVAMLVAEMRRLRKSGLSNRAIARRLGVGRTSVIRLLPKQRKARRLAFRKSV
jgi:putative DNA-invertase from lambdoid prophage Rac